MCYNVLSIGTMKRGKQMPFKPGQSGNLSGRPRGATSQLIIREALSTHGAGESGLLQSIIEAALGGDVSAAGLLIGRLYAPLRAVQPAEQFPLNGTTAAEKASSILDAIASGALAPDVGRSLIDAVSSLLKIQEITELAQRLEAIEAKIAEAQR